MVPQFQWMITKNGAIPYFQTHITTATQTQFRTASQQASLKTWGPRRKGRRRFRIRSFQRRSVAVSGWAGSKKMVLKCAEDFLDLPDVIYIYIYTDWWFGTWMDYDFPETVGNVIIPTDELIFFRGVGIPPTSIYIYIHTYIYNIHTYIYTYIYIYIYIYISVCVSVISMVGRQL